MKVLYVRSERKAEFLEYFYIHNYLRIMTQEDKTFVVQAAICIRTETYAHLKVPQMNINAGWKFDFA